MTSASSLHLLLPFLMFISPSRSVSDISESEQNLTGIGESTSLPVLLVSVCVLTVVCAAVLAMCMDCYNSEVSSSSHPACGGPKAGAHSEYYPSHVASEVNTRLDHDPLPYSALPYQMPENSGFSGYPSADNAGGRTGGQGRGQNHNAGQGQNHNTGQGQNGTDSHANPAEDEPPPPSYGEAIQSYR